AAVGLRHRDAEQAELRHAADNAVAVEPMLAIVLPDVRSDVPGRPLTNRLFEEPVLVGEVEVDHAGLRNRISRCLFRSRNESATVSPSNSLMMSRLGSDACRGRSAGYMRYRRFTSSATMNLV